MKIIQIIKHNLNSGWHKGIFVRTALLSWILIILTLLTFIVGTLPYQLEVVKSRMKSEANDIAGSIGQVTATAIVNNDYGFTVNHCLKIIKQSNSILYINITRKDGFSLIHTANGWKQTTLKNKFNDLPGNETTSQFVYSPLVNQEVFHYSYPLSYSDLDWGRINVGLSLEKYNQNINYLYYRTLGLAIFSIFIGLLASVYFAKMLTQPIRELNNFAEKVSEGNLSVRVKINIENEIGRLAQSFNKMTESLQHSQDHLERNVRERTEELEKMNKILNIEIKERLTAENTLRQYNLRLETLDKIYRGIISAKTVEEIVIETINNIHKLFPGANRATVDLYNYKEHKDTLFHKSFEHNKNHGATANKFLLNNVKSYIKEIVSDQEIITGELTPQQSDCLKSSISAPLIMEEERIGSLNLSSSKEKYFTNEHKEILFIIANQLAIAIYQAQLQYKIKEHAHSLQNSLSEKEVLLKEIHHRVKNNLQIISSLLYLQSTKAKDEQTLHLFEDSQNRIKSMALIHEKLYQSKDFAMVNFNEYMQGLIQHLNSSFRKNNINFKTIVNINEIFLSLDTAISCGLIVNELFTNAYKYAFPFEWVNSQPKGTEFWIEINIVKEGLQYILTVSDNGIGVPTGIDIKKAASLGLKLVSSMVHQLDGSIEISRTNGTQFKIRFKDSK